MSISLKIISISFLILVILTVLNLVKKEKILVKYSLVWLFPSVLLLISTMFPSFLQWATKLMGFQESSNMILTILVCLLLIITLTLTVIVSHLKEQLRNLVQEISIIKARDKNE